MHFPVNRDEPYFYPVSGFEVQKFIQKFRGFEIQSSEVQARQPLSPTRRKPIPGGSMAASLPPAVGSIGYLAFADGWVFFVEYFVYFRIEAPLHQFTYL